MTPTEPVYPAIRALDVPRHRPRPCPTSAAAPAAARCSRSWPSRATRRSPRWAWTSAATRMVDGVRGVRLQRRRRRSTCPAVGVRASRPDFTQRRARRWPRRPSARTTCAATPLQMALVAAGIANDGVIMEPHVVDEIRDGEGDLVERLEPTQWKRAVSARRPPTSCARPCARWWPTAAPPGSRSPASTSGAKTGTAQFGPSAPLQLARLGHRLRRAARSGAHRRRRRASSRARTAPASRPAAGWPPRSPSRSSRPPLQPMPAPPADATTTTVHRRRWRTDGRTAAVPELARRPVS